MEEMLSGPIAVLTFTYLAIELLARLRRAARQLRNTGDSSHETETVNRRS